MIYAARILYPVKVLGPGDRVGIWLAGCPRRCSGCSNPELWTQEERYRTDTDTVMQLVESISARFPIDGFTVTGGDPFFQEEALVDLLSRLTRISEDILVYTGYRFEELHPDALRDIAVLIDGEYVEKLNRGEALRGSANQRIIYLKERYRKPYERFIACSQGRIQNFATHDGIISAGIHLPGYEKDLERKARERGLDTSGGIKE